MYKRQELEGFAQTVIATEQAIQTGSQTLAAAYNDKVEIDLNQYQQVGAAVAYEVIAGVNGTVSQTQVEQTSFAPGQEVKALITDAAGNVSAVTVVVGENGVVPVSYTHLDVYKRQDFQSESGAVYHESDI